MIETRPELEDDFPAIRELIAATMRILTADLVELIREGDGYVPQLSRVAVNQAGEVVGYVMLNRVELVGDKTWSVLSLSPLAVTPTLQRAGIGSALVNDVLSVADELGETMVVVLGHAAYYPRFGFLPARKMGIAPPWHSQLPDDVWMARPLANYDPEMRGVISYPSTYATTESVPT
ncbi:MAG: N-acetyltransferase [Candidatus Dormiibacterota bacterium]